MFTTIFSINLILGASPISEPMMLLDVLPLPKLNEWIPKMMLSLNVSPLKNMATVFWISIRQI